MPMGDSTNHNQIQRVVFGTSFKKHTLASEIRLMDFASAKDEMLQYVSDESSPGIVSCLLSRDSRARGMDMHR